MLILQTQTHTHLIFNNEYRITICTLSNQVRSELHSSVINKNHSEDSFHHYTYQHSRKIHTRNVMRCLVRIVIKVKQKVIYCQFNIIFIYYYYIVQLLINSKIKLQYVINQMIIHFGNFCQKPTSHLIHDRLQQVQRRAVPALPWLLLQPGRQQVAFIRHVRKSRPSQLAGARLPGLVRHQTLYS